MKQALEKIKARALTELEAASDMKQLDELRVRILGKKGELTAILKQMGSLGPAERPAIGQLANEVRQTIEDALDKRLEALKNAGVALRLKAEAIDVTMPGSAPALGKRHPLTIVLDEMKEIFMGMGYDVVEGPEVEWTRYNFDMLNAEPGHPSRDERDTFYISDDILLRTQTSPVQVRTMLNRKPPIYVIAPGRVYRKDTVDATHSPLFHQIEGLVVDKNITLGNLKSTLEIFAKRLYGEDAQIRFRPHHFPFTEPSAEVDVMCFACQGEGCRLCKGEGWIEILGAGMVHPNVLKNCGIDPEEYSGFAFGIGLERLTMRKYNIDDLRLLYENDLRFLSQF